MLKLKLQYFGNLVGRTYSLEKTRMLGGIGGRGRTGQQRIRWLDGCDGWIDGCESWTGKRAECQRTVVLEKTPESPLDCKVIQPVHSEGDQSWVFFGRTDAEAETPVLWPPHAKS